MRHRLIISDYNRDALRQVSRRTRPGHHPPLVLIGPSGVGKSLLLDTLQRRAAGEPKRMTAEEWISKVSRDLRTHRHSSVRAFAGSALTLLDNAEVLAGKTRTQECLAEAIVTAGGSVVIVANSALPTLRPLLRALKPSSPEILQIPRPTSLELRRIACLLSPNHCKTSAPQGIDDAGNPGEILGLITRSRARRALVGVP